MIDSDVEKEQLDQKFSLLETRAKKRRRSSILLTFVLVFVTAVLVLQLANEVVVQQERARTAEKPQAAASSQVDELRRQSELLAKLDAERKQLEKANKNFQQRILDDKGIGEGIITTAGRTPEPISSNVTPPPHGPETEDIQEKAEALVIEEDGKAPAGFVMTPKVDVLPSRGTSGREIFKVRLWLEVPADKRGEVEQVTYHLSPKHYLLKRLIEGDATPPFAANFNVFSCESTALARAKLKNGATVAVDFDWCDHAGWPERKKEVVILAPEEEKQPAKPATVPSHTPVPVPIPTPR